MIDGYSLAFVALVIIVVILLLLVVWCLKGDE